jgi:nicotinate phosphoribosyltransferase
MAHSFVTTFQREVDAFRAYAASFPESTTLLVDTYDTLEGVRKALTVAAELRRAGRRLVAVRLDSGNLLELARGSRRLMDEAGFPEVKIFASGGLDEYEVDELLAAGAPIDGFGVGTKAGVSADAPATDCAYKLVEYAGRPVLKLSTGKQTLPGPRQVFRFRGADGTWARDVIARAEEPTPTGAEALLAEVMKSGRRLQPPASLGDLRERFRAVFAQLPDRHKALRSPALYDVSVSSDLEALARRVVEDTHRRELGADAGK